MDNQVLKNQAVSKRGGVIPEPPNQSTVIVRLSNYSRKYWHREPAKLTQEQRLIATKVLSDNFAFQQKDIAALLHISRITSHKDKQSADFYHDRMVNFREKCKKLEDYIRYFSKFIPAV